MEIVNQLPHQNGLKSHVDIADIYIEQYFVGCLAEFSYYIESAGEAIIIDPFTEPQPYMFTIHPHHTIFFPIVTY